MHVFTEVYLELTIFFFRGNRLLSYSIQSDFYAFFNYCRFRGRQRKQFTIYKLNFRCFPVAALFVAGLATRCVGFSYGTAVVMIHCPQPEAYSWMTHYGATWPPAVPHAEVRTRFGSGPLDPFPWHQPDLTRESRLVRPTEIARVCGVSGRRKPRARRFPLSVCSAFTLSICVKRLLDN